MSFDEEVKSVNDDSKGKMIAFLSSKGGVGKTIISVNMAVALSNKGFSTCILDGSFQFGDVNLALDIKPVATISDLIQENQSLDNADISKYLHIHESGVMVLSAPSKPEYADLVTVSAIPAICEKLMIKNDFLLVDLPTGLSEHNLSFLEKSDKIFLITDLEMAALKNTKIILKTLKMLDMEQKIKVILNRSDMDNMIKAKDVENILEVDDIACISNNYKVVSKTFNIGIPFVICKPNEKISKEIVELTGEFDSNKPMYKRRLRSKQRRR